MVIPKSIENMGRKVNYAAADNRCIQSFKGHFLHCFFMLFSYFLQHFFFFLDLSFFAKILFRLILDCKRAYLNLDLQVVKRHSFKTQYKGDPFPNRSCIVSIHDIYNYPHPRSLDQMHSHAVDRPVDLYY